MSYQFKQTIMMVITSLGSLPRRIWISFSMVFSIALVVGVLVGFLSMAKGFETALIGAGSPSVAIILGGGTNQEIGSEIPADAIRTMKATTGDTGIARDAGGDLVLSREIMVPVDLKRVTDGANQTLALRGMDAVGPLLRTSASISEGRLFTPGSREIVVGTQLAREFSGLGVGEKVRIGAVDWTVVGHFSAGGSAFESEIWADLEAVQSGFDMQGRIQVLRVRLIDPANLVTLQDALSSFSQAPMVAVSEAELFASQSERTSNLIRLFGWPLAFLMAIGATAGALNTMLTSVSDRSIEIATVRALGFSRLSAFMGTWFEAVVLAAAGATIGAAASWLIFNGWQASTLGANNTQMAFQLKVTSDVALTGALLGLAIGIVGGALPALIATRIPLTSALRAKG